MSLRDQVRAALQRDATDTTYTAPPPTPKEIAEAQVDAAQARLAQIASAAFTPLTGTQVTTLRDQTNQRLSLIWEAVQDEARYLQEVIKLVRDDYTGGTP